GDKDLHTQMNSAVTLVNLAADGAPGLLEKVREADRKGRWAVPLSRARFGAVPPEAVLKWAKQLEDKDPQARLRAAVALGQLAPRSAAAAEALGKALRDEEVQVRLV